MSPAGRAARVRVSAPGKLMIAGEYVVLDGAEALVASVDARLIAVGSRGSQDGSPAPTAGSADRPSLPPEALLTRQRAEAALGEVPEMTLSLDASALRSSDGPDRKLGLGSSAAASAAAAGAVLAWHGEDPAAHRRDVLKWALAGHRAVAPEGSGADVAAATLGGVVRFCREAAEDAEVIAWPAGLAVDVVWTGTPARTSELVAKVSALRACAPESYDLAMGALREAAERLLSAIVGGDADATVVAARAHHDAMRVLGERAGAPIVTPALGAAAALAERFGGAAKPSGAGGGDVALAFFSDEAGRAAFRAACADTELTLLSLVMGAEGVRLDAPVADPSR